MSGAIPLLHVHSADTDSLTRFHWSDNGVWQAYLACWTTETGLRQDKEALVIKCKGSEFRELHGNKQNFDHRYHTANFCVANSNLHNGAKLFLSLSCFIEAGIFEYVVDLLCEHARPHTHTSARAKKKIHSVKRGNVMRVGCCVVFFFQANGEQPDMYTSLATSRIVW